MKKKTLRNGWTCEEEKGMYVAPNKLPKKLINTTAVAKPVLPDDVMVKVKNYSRVIRAAHCALKAHIRCGSAMLELEKALEDIGVYLK